MERYFLERRGAQFRNQRGADRYYVVPGQARRPYIPVPHGKRERKLPGRFVKKLVKQAGGSAEDFLDFLKKS